MKSRCLAIIIDPPDGDDGEEMNEIEIVDWWKENQAPGTLPGQFKRIEEDIDSKK